MFLYLGNKKKMKIYFNGKKRVLRMSCGEMPTIKNTILVSADGYILKDANGLYLTIQGDK